MNATSPKEIKLHKKSAILELIYTDGSRLHFPAEFLRVHSPSAEVRGHGKGQETLQTGKRHIKLEQIESVGNYAIKLEFDDGHNTGIFSWGYLQDLGNNQKKLWNDYLSKLEKAGKTREPLPANVQILNLKPESK